MPGLTEQLLLDQLREEDNAAFRVLYESYFPSTANYIRQNSGDNRDAEDIFQEAVVVLLDKIRQPDFVLTSSLKTYLFTHLFDTLVFLIGGSVFILPAHFEHQAFFF